MARPPFFQNFCTLASGCHPGPDHHTREYAKLSFTQTQFALDLDSYDGEHGPHREVQALAEEGFGKTVSFDAGHM
jgi:hypothetical protein